MSRKPNYSIETKTADKLVLRDLGPWNLHPTITNGAEEVIADLQVQNVLDGRRVFYYDSENKIDELRHERGRFVGFGR